MKLIKQIIQNIITVVIVIWITNTTVISFDRPVGGSVKHTSVNLNAMTKKITKVITKT